VPKRCRYRRSVGPYVDETKLKLSLNCKGITIKIFDISGNLIKKFPTLTATADYLYIGRYKSDRLLVIAPDHNVLVQMESHSGE